MRGTTGALLLFLLQALVELGGAVVDSSVNSRVDNGFAFGSDFSYGSDVVGAFFSDSSLDSRVDADGQIEISGNASMSPEISAVNKGWAKIRTLGWMSMDQVKPPIPGDTMEQTVIVTHAGKNHQEYIDMAVMLGLSLNKYVPDVPRVAMSIAGMTVDHQALLRNVGWRVLQVEEVNLCKGDKKCDDHFMHRWRESFEKLNSFRLPFKRVLFLDADTYVFSSEIRTLVNTSFEIEGKAIAMAADGCKKNIRTHRTEYNSGVMLFQPSLDKFYAIMDLASTRSGDEMLDQNLVNEVFDGDIYELNKKFDCIDPIGVPPGLKEACPKERICGNEVVISHFTGLFKPTKANPQYLRHVQQAQSITEICENTNHGGCQQWAPYYCDMYTNRKSLTQELQQTLAVVGGCCMGANQNRAECTYRTVFNNQTDACPPHVEFSHREKVHPWMSRFALTNMTPTAFNEYRPIYASDTEGYMFYLASKRNWMVGASPMHDNAFSFAHADALCPQDANHWQVLNARMTWQSVPTLKVWAPHQGCASSLRVVEGDGWPTGANTSWTGTYNMRSDLTSGMHGGKPVYERHLEGPGEHPFYMYFLAAKTRWVVGPDWKEWGNGVAYIEGDSFCPRESMAWQVRPQWTSGKRVLAQLLIVDEKCLSAPKHVSTPSSAKAAAFLGPKERTELDWSLVSRASSDLARPSL